MEPAPTWILPLAAPLPLAVAGGKAANLARLVAGGFPVPPGFVISTAAYQAFVAENGLADLIQSALGVTAADDLAALENAARTIHARFAADGRLPAGLAEAVLAAYDALGRPAVAVRSSATAEDLPDQSFAGQQDTYLNVVGDEALLQAVVNCWSSLWTARAIGYRARHDQGHFDPQADHQSGLALAVIVQAMVPSQAAGVLFTANPLTGNRGEMVVEATLGLGEALVSGQVEPDRYLIDVSSGQIESRALGAKALSIRGRPGGGTSSQPEEAADRYALPDAAVGELAHLGRQVAEFFGAPQDVEWAWAAEQIYLLQSRPITSLFPLPAGLPVEPLRVMFSFGAVQGLLDPITPLGQDAIRSAMAGAAGLFGYHLTAQTQRIGWSAAERLFVDITALVRHRTGRSVARFAATQIEPGAAEALEGLFDDPRLSITGGFTPGGLRRIVPFALPVLGRLLLCLLRPDAQRLRFQQVLQTTATDLETRMAAATNLPERLAVTEDILARAFHHVLPQFIPRFGASMASLNILRHMAAGLPGQGGLADVLILTRGLPHNVTTEMDLALWAVAQRIKADPRSADDFARLDPGSLAADYVTGRLPAPAQSAIAGFLQRYGIRGLGEIDLGRPRWREDPAPVMHTLQSYLHIEDGEQAPDVAFERGAAAALEGIQRLAADVRHSRGGWFKARLVRWAARRLRALAGLRESPKFWIIRLMGISRAALLASGRELVAGGRLAAPEDLFFLHLPELHALANGQEQDWRALVRQRREQYAREQQRQQIPRLLLSDGRAFYGGSALPAGAAGASDGNVLTGSPVSPGVVEGTVRVVLDPQAAHLAPGEILVCPGTDPAWTPLFLLAGGLVTEVGGMMTHGSVVAREYGIPAVVGVAQATTRLQTGQRVRLDGTQGRIVLLA
jgi:phosphohistidine swiveling domain-containing protein